MTKTEFVIFRVLLLNGALYLTVCRVSSGAINEVVQVSSGAIHEVVQVSSGAIHEVVQVSSGAS
jgi:hypothetical protein